MRDARGEAQDAAGRAMALVHKGARRRAAANIGLGARRAMSGAAIDNDSDAFLDVGATLQTPYGAYSGVPTPSAGAETV